MDKITSIKITAGDYNAGVDGVYKYNVQIFHNGTYSGHGRYYKTYAEAINYIINELKGDTKQ